MELAFTRTFPVISNCSLGEFFPLFIPTKPFSVIVILSTLFVRIFKGNEEVVPKYESEDTLEFPDIPQEGNSVQDN